MTVCHDVVSSVANPKVNGVKWVYQLRRSCVNFASDGAAGISWWSITGRSVF